MARPATGTIRSIRLGFVLIMSLIVSDTSSLAWSRPAFLNHAIDATFQQIPLARLISQLSTLSDGIIVLDRQIDPNAIRHAHLPRRRPHGCPLYSCRYDQHRNKRFLNQAYGLCQLVRPVSLEAADDERKAALQKLPAHTRQSLSVKQPLQWQAGQKPIVIIEKLLERLKTDTLSVTPDNLSTVIPHDHLAAGSIPPLSLPEQLDLVVMQYNHHLLWQQKPSECISCFGPVCSTASPN